MTLTPADSNKTAKVVVKPPALCTPYLTGRLQSRLSAARPCIRIGQLYFGLEVRERTQFVVHLLLAELPQPAIAPLRCNRPLDRGTQALDQGLLFKRFT